MEKPEDILKIPVFFEIISLSNASENLSIVIKSLAVLILISKTTLFFFF